MTPAAHHKQFDSLDLILKHWERERPDLDARPMGPIGRIKRCAALLEQYLEAGLSQFGLSYWEFDMLATLRRSGAPYCLTPTTLFSTLMVTSGTMTHRLKRMEQRGLVARVPNEQDARSMLVQLTDKGLNLIDRAVEKHIENERRLLSVMPPNMLAELNVRLSTLLVALENPGELSLLPAA